MLEQLCSSIPFQQKQLLTNCCHSFDSSLLFASFSQKMKRHNEQDRKLLRSDTNQAMDDKSLQQRIPRQSNSLTKHIREVFCSGSPNSGSGGLASIARPNSSRAPASYCTLDGDKASLRGRLCLHAAANGKLHGKKNSIKLYSYFLHIPRHEQLPSVLTIQHVSTLSSPANRLPPEFEAATPTKVPVQLLVPPN